MNFGKFFLCICVCIGSLGIVIDAEDANAGNAMKPGIGAIGALSDFVENIGEEVEHEVFMDSSVEQVIENQQNSMECIASRVKLCKLTTPDGANGECKKIRNAELQKKKLFYKLRKLDPNPGPGEFKIPVLDQPAKAISDLSMTDPFTAHHFNMLFLAFGMNLRDVIIPAAIAKFAGKDMTSYEDYFEITDFFKKELKLDKPGSKYFRVPSNNKELYTDVEENEKFTTDKYFAQFRLAGLNPMSIQRITQEEGVGLQWKTLSDRLNMDFNWEEQIQKITEKDLENSINENMVYALEFPLLDDIKDMPDILAGKTKPPNAKMLPHKNPIAIFATKLHKKSMKYYMKVVAIQVDSKKDADVYTPKDGLNWQFAKALVQAADFLFSQIHEHLLRTHFRMEPVCVSLYRHLSQLHPIHEILKYHCRGLFPLNANGTIVLLTPGKYAHALFSVGHYGAFTLLQRGYEKMVWNDFGIENVQRRGMDDKEKVPFYPYRDDGIIIDKALKQFGARLVDLYYPTDESVVADEEIQNFINELSVDGDKPPFNGQGHIKGLPGSFETKDQVAKFIAETLWIQVQHAVISFTPGVLGTQAPIYPTKLYDDPRAKQKNDFVYMLPGALAACMHAGLSHTVGALQYDVMFDYSDEIRDPKLKSLVADTYHNFMCNIKKRLDARNKQRANGGKLTNPFMVPGWMPNSIST